jgi:hypothetical protein
VEIDTGFDPIRKVAPRAAKLGDAERDELIAHNPDFGVIICRCEEISKGEIVAALRRNIPCDTIDGVKRRVRPGMGRCQGGFCGPLVLDIIAREKNIAHDKVKKSGDGSHLLFGSTKRSMRAIRVAPSPLHEFALKQESAASADTDENLEENESAEATTFDYDLGEYENAGAAGSDDDTKENGTQGSASLGNDPTKEGS